MDSKMFNQVRCSVLFSMIDDLQAQQAQDRGRLIELIRAQLPEDLRRARILTTDEVERGTDRGWVRSGTPRGPVPGWMFEGARNAIVRTDIDWEADTPPAESETAYDTCASLNAVFAAEVAGALPVTTTWAMGWLQPDPQPNREDPRSLGQADHMSVSQALLFVYRWLRRIAA